MIAEHEIKQKHAEMSVEDIREWLEKYDCSIRKFSPDNVFIQSCIATSDRLHTLLNEIDRLNLLLEELK